MKTLSKIVLIGLAFLSTISVTEIQAQKSLRQTMDKREYSN